jgi:ATP-dependent Zn protease
MADAPMDYSEAANYLRGMAYHEAGHAVVAWSFGLEVGEIHIREIGAGNGGAQIGCADHLPLVDQLASLAAGKEAERFFKSPLPDHASDCDRVMAIDLVLKLHVGLASDEIEPHLSAGHARARERLDEHQHRVTRLADRLFQDRHVSASTFEGLMR